MSDDVVERIARAMCDRQLNDAEISARSWSSYREEYISDVRAAIEALRPGDELPGGLVVVDQETLEAAKSAVRAARL